MPALCFPQSTPVWRRVSLIPVLLALAACESGPRPPPGHGSNPGAVEPATPEMEAHGVFFAGKIEVETLLNRTGFAGRIRGGGTDGGSGSGSARGGGGRRGSGGRGGERGAGAGGGAYGQARNGDDTEPVPRIRSSNLPAVRLHLRLTNHDSAPIEVAVTDFNSDLGNFVVEPAKILLPPNESIEADPMTSQLGVSADAIPLTVTLKTGDRTEKQVLTLRLIKPDLPVDPAKPSP